MEELLSSYSLTDILTFIVILALATKGVVSFYDWARDRIKQIFDKEHTTETEKEKLDDKLQKYDILLEETKTKQDELYTSIKDLSDKVDMLINSDRDDIKSFLTREHHFYCYQKGWIDDYSLECCEKRYSHYKEEGGNSFIAGFMDELRALPKQPPQE